MHTRVGSVSMDFVYYEEIKREQHRRRIYECRCDERLKGKTEGLIDERFTSVMGECVN